METMKRLLWNIMATVSLLIMTIGCGTNEEGGENGEPKIRKQSQWQSQLQ